MENNQNRRATDRRATDRQSPVSGEHLPVEPHNFKRRATDHTHTLVPAAAPKALLVSMALILDKSFGVRSDDEKTEMLDKLSLVYAEVVGHGFYCEENADYFEAVLAFQSDPVAGKALVRDETRKVTLEPAVEEEIENLYGDLA